MLLRLADAARLAEVWFHGIEPAVLRHRKFKAAARSAERMLNLRHSTSPADLSALQETHQFLALEWTNTSVPFTDLQPAAPTVLVVGNEKRGVSQPLLDLCTAAVHVPMYGLNSSMNVSMASAIVVYDLIGKLGASPIG